jgi:DNA-binding MarR family transcriptional regulator
MLDKNSNATRLVEKLRLKNLIERNTCPNDRRQVEIGIKDEGLSMLSAIDIEFNEWAANYKDLSEEEAVQLNFLLDKMRG